METVVAPGDRVLWVASSGGHLTELMHIARMTGASNESLWVTFDTEHARSLTADGPATLVPYMEPRAIAKLARLLPTAWHILRNGDFDACVSTGASIAGAFLPLAAAAGLKTQYIESLARTTGPSATGRLLAPWPKVRTSTQHRSWTSARWHYGGSLLSGWDSIVAPSPKPMRRIFVTLGTIQPYRFDRLVDAVLRCLSPDDTVQWQLGATVRDDLPGEIHGFVSAAQFQDMAAQADVVVSHAGVGTLLDLWSLGIAPVIAARDPLHAEHVDGHQREIVPVTYAHNLAVPMQLTNPDREQLLRASRLRVVESARA
jgi:UDP-N-acetylglucosamine--N-acetylmuramyl-(pentapeptide) pyrophosphoryl-undecaprenol N-acetylglucosamine transferase